MDWLVDWLIGGMIDWLVVWLIDWFINVVFIDWLIYLCLDPGVVQQDSYTVVGGSNLTLPCTEGLEAEHALHTLIWFCRYMGYLFEEKIVCKCIFLDTKYDIF